VNHWLQTASIQLYQRTASRRGALGWLGRAAGGLVAVGVAVASGGTVQAADTTTPRPAPPPPILLPKGQQATAPRDCNQCSGDAEYVCSNCCVGATCCPGSLYRQPCYDSNCQLYYVYWCA
jgi:hypothetical protein